MWILLWIKAASCIKEMLRFQFYKICKLFVYNNNDNNLFFSIKLY